MLLMKTSPSFLINWFKNYKRSNMIMHKLVKTDYYLWQFLLDYQLIINDFTYFHQNSYQSVNYLYSLYTMKILKKITQIV